MHISSGANDEAHGNAATSKKIKVDDTLVKRVNEMDPEDFRSKYVREGWLHYHIRNRAPLYEVDLSSVLELKTRQLDACYDLIEDTSRPAYETSSWGWHPRAKKREMKDDDMHYLLVRQLHAEPLAADSEANVAGFLSFMITHDSTPAVPVLYIYEIHLIESLRGVGLGAHLMKIAESIARSIGVEKVMLTCFLSNETALKFYEGRGYRVDACSPEDRQIRNKLVKADYMIMSKAVTQIVDDRSNETMADRGLVRAHMRTQVEAVSDGRHKSSGIDFGPSKWEVFESESWQSWHNRLDADSQTRVEDLVKYAKDHGNYQYSRDLIVESEPWNSWLHSLDRAIQVRVWDSLEDPEEGSGEDKRLKGELREDTTGHDSLIGRSCVTDKSTDDDSEDDYSEDDDSVDKGDPMDDSSSEASLGGGEFATYEEARREYYRAMKQYRYLADRVTEEFIENPGIPPMYPNSHELLKPFRKAKKRVDAILEEIWARWPNKEEEQ